MPEPAAEPSAARSRPWSGGGREELADAVRRLVSATVTSTAPPEALAEATATLVSVAEALERQVPAAGSVPASRYADDPGATFTLAGVMPFDVVIGACNPLAPPVTVEFEPPKAVGHATFTAPHQGAPGCVHGAVLAAVFDIMLTAANVVADAAGPTVWLTIRYLAPTVLDKPSHFEAWVTSTEGRRTRSRGTLTQGGVVTVEAEGEFVTMDRSLIESMHRRGGGRADHTATMATMSSTLVPSPGTEPTNPASPKANTPPSDPTIQ